MKIYESISAVLKCGEDILMIKRPNFMRAFPGYHAFPGGKVDEEDKKVVFQNQLINNQEPSLFNAINRELEEELKIKLDQEIESGNCISFQYLGAALTPDFNPYRFNNHFSLIEFKNKPEITPFKKEVESFKWKPANYFFDQYEKGKLLVVPPIINLLRNLKDQTLEKDFDFTYDAEKVVPMIESIKGVIQLMPLSNTLLPATRTNAFVLGDKSDKQILIDPSPKSEAELEKLWTTIKPMNIKMIFLTHHHGDHHERSVELATRLNVPMGMSLDCLERIKKKKGENYFLDLEIKIFKEGDTIGSWLGEELNIFELPGHDEGHLGIAPKSQSFFIVGDLIQGIGSVVVGGDEGDMIKYLSSLEKVISLNPSVIFPSHGIGLGGTYRLQKTKEHRLFRENQVLELLQKGKSEEDILDTLYFDVDKSLRFAALANIRSHIKKLVSEGKIVYESK